jgi:ribosomal protein L28
MSYVCDICEKKTVFGVSQQHGRGVAGKRWKKRAQATKRTFKPNLQKVSITMGGETSQMLLCTKCIKRIRNYKSIGDIKNIVLA